MFDMKSRKALTLRSMLRNRGKYVKFSKCRVLQKPKNSFADFDWMMI